MTIEQLLYPRFEVISDYPDSPFYEGQVIVCDQVRPPMFSIAPHADDTKLQCTSFIPIKGDHDTMGSATYSIVFFRRYQKLFREMKWWEQRTLEEMSVVKYLKYMSLSEERYKYIKVEEWTIGNYFSHKNVILASKYICPSVDLYFDIATEEEYNDYLRTPKQ